MIRRLVVLLTIGAACCAAPGVQFDRGPRPGWTSISTRTVGGVIEAVGSAPATANPNRDADLALRDAKGRIARMVESQVFARSSDWSLSVAGPSGHERQVLSQSIEIRSRASVEDVEVAGAYRDEATRTQYVRIHVDRVAWAQRVQRRLDQDLQGAEDRLVAARAALVGHRALRAYELALAGSAAVRVMESDVLLSDVLSERSAARTRLQDVELEFEAVRREASGSHPFAIEIDAPPGPARRLRVDLQEFLKSYGFGVRDAGRPVRMTIRLGQRYLRTDRVANRSEYVYAAMGEISVRDADGSHVERLSLQLPSERYLERDVTRDAAARKALLLAADSVASGFRSAFREVFPAEM